MIAVVMPVDIDIDIAVDVDVAVDVTVDIAVDAGTGVVADLPRLGLARQSPARRHDDHEGHEQCHAFANDAGVHVSAPLHDVLWQCLCHGRSLTACAQAALVVYAALAPAV